MNIDVRVCDVSKVTGVITRLTISMNADVRMSKVTGLITRLTISMNTDVHANCQRSLVE